MTTEIAVCSCGAEMRVHETLEPSGTRILTGQCPVCERWSNILIHDPVDHDIRVTVIGYSIAYKEYGQFRSRVFLFEELAEMDEFEKTLHARHIGYTIAPQASEDSPSYTKGDILDGRVVYVYPDREVRA